MENDAPVAFEIIPPSDTPEFMYDAYFSCFFWAIQFDPILQQFLSDTGLAIPVPRPPIVQMVDKATGFNPYKEFVHAFVPWFNLNVWGPIDGTEEE
jgi:hypothetical protein